MKTKLPDKQREVLETLKLGFSLSWDSFRKRFNFSEMEKTIHPNTIYSLENKGFIKEYDSYYIITPAGKEALKELSND